MRHRRQGDCIELVSVQQETIVRGQRRYRAIVKTTGHFQRFVR